MDFYHGNLSLKKSGIKIMPATLKLPIVNVFAKGDYCATLHIGSEKSPVNLIIDSGSSTLVVKEVSYQANEDKHLTATTIAQEVNYGIGGWNGPIINSTITINSSDNNNENSNKNLQQNKTKQVSH